VLARRPGCAPFAGGLPSLPHSNFGGKHGTFRGDAICWACDSSGLGGRLYPFSGEQVRVREADREITRLCAWGDKVHRKDRPEREEARDLENENSIPSMPYRFLTTLTAATCRKSGNRASPSRRSSTKRRSRTSRAWLSRRGFWSVPRGVESFRYRRFQFTQTIEQEPLRPVSFASGRLISEIYGTTPLCGRSKQSRVIVLGVGITSPEWSFGRSEPKGERSLRYWLLCWGGGTQGSVCRTIGGYWRARQKKSVADPFLSPSVYA
jgi:hypothetical protein